MQEREGEEREGRGERGGERERGAKRGGGGREVGEGRERVRIRGCTVLYVTA